MKQMFGLDHAAVLLQVPLIGPVVSITAGVMDLRLRTFVVWAVLGRLIGSTLIVLWIFEGASCLRDLFSEY